MHMRRIQMLQGWLPQWSRERVRASHRDVAASVLRSLMEHAPLPLCIVRDPHGTLVLANAACRSLVAAPAQPGAPLVELLPHCAAQLREPATRSALQAGQVCRLSVAHAGSEHARGPGPSGCAWLAWRLGGAEHEHIVLVGCEPAPDQQATGAELARVQAKLRSKDEFLAELLHELRGPLSAIETGIALLRSPHADVHARALAALERQTQHMKRLIQDLFELTRDGQGGLSLELERIELASVIERAVELAAALVHARQQKVLVAVPQGLLIQGDPVRMVQIFSNLITNAAKYTERDGVIRITGDVIDGQARIRVSDNGIGIAREQLPRIFELFVRAPRARQREGLGVGLHLVRALVEQHGGQVAAHSDGPGAGSEFTVRLPLCAPERCAQPQAE